MGPKKGKKDEVIDVSTEKFFSTYKKISNTRGVKIFKSLEEDLKEKIKNDEHLNEIFIPERIGKEGAQDLLQALSETKDVNKQEGYKHLHSLRLWDSLILDEGLANIFNYILKCKTGNLKILDLVNSNITKQGCEIISNIFDPRYPTDIQCLNLSYNRFGNEGLIELMNNLKLNETITNLNLAYCDIGKEGMLYFKDLFYNTKNELITLILEGNHIEAKGATDLFNIISSIGNEVKLEELNLQNCFIISNEEFTGIVTTTMVACKNLESYNLQNNNLNDSFLIAVTEVLKKQKAEKDLHIYQFFVPYQFNDEVFQQFYKLMVGRKKPKKKKKKLGKSKPKKVD